MSKKQPTQQLNSKTPAKPSRKKTASSGAEAPEKAATGVEKTPIKGWLPIEKPRLIVKTGEAARQAQREQEAHPHITFWGMMIRLLPLWALLIMILLLEPALPVRAVGAAVGWVRSLIPGRGASPISEPVFIVEGAQGGSVEGELPLPNWSLELSPAFTPEVQYWEDRIAEWSLAYRVKPNLIATLMQIESCGNPAAQSAMGAQGLFQVMPLHFAEGEDPLDPDTNARRGLQYFVEMYAASNGDIGLTFAAYNGGPSVIELSPSEWASETQDYQFWGSGIFEETEQGLRESPTLLDWLAAGGESLCVQAAGALGIPRATPGS